jgi:hypothetical protein
VVTTVVVLPPDSLKLPVIELAEPEELWLPVVMTVCASLPSATDRPRASPASPQTRQPTLLH